jgi:hypothetical protein
MPTFTNPPTLEIPTFEVQEDVISTSNFPMGMLIAFFGIVGILGALFSLLRGR